MTLPGERSPTESWENLSIYLTGGILIGCFIWLIVVTNRGSNFVFVKQVAWLLLAGNIGAITNAIFFEQLRDLNTADNSGFSIVMASLMTSLAIFVENTGFALGQWVFAYQYFSISKEAY